MRDASDAELTAALARCAEARRRVEAVLAGLVGDVERRSARDRGYDGLAQASGARTPDILVSQLTGVSGSEARALVTAGTLAPWLGDVATAVDAGALSIGAAAAISTGLGSPSASVAADDLQDAARALALEATALPPEKAARRAREVRDALDASGVAEREASLRDRRFLRLTPQPDGMTRLFGMLDPESAALVADAVDCVTAPRRGGPRFVDPDELARVEALEKDPRTTEQLAVDALVEMVRVAGAADDGRVFGVRRPARRAGPRLGPRSRDRERHGVARRADGVGVDRDRGPFRVCRRIPAGGVPTRRVTRRRARAATLHREAAGRPRGRVGWMRGGDVRPAPVVDRSASRRSVVARRTHRRRGRGAAVPTSSSAAAQQRVAHHAATGSGSAGWAMTDGIRTLRLEVKNPVHRRSVGATDVDPREVLPDPSERP